MGELMALALVCTMAAAVLFQPALMGRPREKSVWVVRRETPAGTAAQTVPSRAEPALAEMRNSGDERE
jgi:hypothetical protein